MGTWIQFRNDWCEYVFLHPQKSLVMERRYDHLCWNSLNNRVYRCLAHKNLAKKISGSGYVTYQIVDSVIIYFSTVFENADCQNNFELPPSAWLLHILMPVLTPVLSLSQGMLAHSYLFSCLFSVLFLYLFQEHSFPCLYWPKCHVRLACILHKI